MGVCANKAFLSNIPIKIDLKQPYRPVQTHDAGHESFTVTCKRQDAPLCVPLLITEVGTMAAG